jgi:hypothetical protein
MEEEVCHPELLARKRELEKITVDEKDDIGEQEASGDGSGDNDDSANVVQFTDQSRWVQLVLGGKTVEAVDLIASSKGAEFACIHNRDSLDFMNIDKFKRFILKRTNSVNPPRWDLFDEINSKVIDHIVEDEDQGPSKEWGPFGCYRHPTEEHIQKACGGKTIELSM